MEMLGQKIDFLGDSITEGCGTSGPGYCFADLLASEYGILTVNHGISGTRIARQRVPSDEPRFDLDFCSRVPELDSDADVIMVFGGTNDFGHGDVPLGTINDRDNTTFYGALHVLYRQLWEKYPTATITPLSIYQPTGSSTKKITFHIETRK